MSAPVPATLSTPTSPPAVTPLGWRAPTLNRPNHGRGVLGARSGLASSSSSPSVPSRGFRPPPGDQPLGQPPTVICPVIPGWKVQRYLYVPAVVNCTCQVLPCC